MRQWHSIIEFKFNRLSQAESGGVSSKRSGLRRLRRGRPRGARRRPRREPTLWRRFAFGWRRLPNRLPLSLSLSNSPSRKKEPPASGGSGAVSEATSATSSSSARRKAKAPSASPSSLHRGPRRLPAPKAARAAPPAAVTRPQESESSALRACRPPLRRCYDCRMHASGIMGGCLGSTRCFGELPEWEKEKYNGDTC